MPFGAGVGTFVPVYQLFETPQLYIAQAHINRAHNDLAELALESGVFGVIVLFGLVIWWLRRGGRVWRRSLPAQREIDLLLPRAASIMIFVPLLHSLVDYPLRTAAIGALVAVGSALLLTPPTRLAGPAGERSDHVAQGAAAR
jgi:O-antigen ligase